MRGLWYVLFLVLGTGLLAACDRDEDGGGFATAPSLAAASGACSAPSQTTLNNAFTNSQTRNNVKDFAQEMVQAFGQNKPGRATWFGFQVLQAIDTALRTPTTLAARNTLAIGTFPCMKLGTATIPTNLTDQLGDNGAFGVRGRPTADFEAVLDHNSTWILEPPEPQSWQDITTEDDTSTVERRTGITGDTAKLFLVLGKPGTTSNFVGTGDQLLAGSFDWTTIPKANFGNPYVVVGNCDQAGGFLQHFPASNTNAEIFGFIQPAQCPGDELSLERAPRSLAERLFRVLSPAPAYAAALAKAGSGGGAKPALSPFGIVKPGAVNLSRFSTSPNKKNNIRGQEFTPTPVINPRTSGGVTFRQSNVLVYLSPIVNLGTPGFICYNWAYSDDTGVTDFPHAFYTKAGGLSLVATTVGTAVADESTGEPVPPVAAGAGATSASFNVKNSSTVIDVCPVFDGTTYFTNVFDPSSGVAFDPDDPDTYPPNYDVEPFPEE